MQKIKHQQDNNITEHQSMSPVQADRQTT